MANISYTKHEQGADAVLVLVDNGDSTYSPRVALAAGENHIGSVGTHGTTIEQTPTITAGAYVAGDAVGGKLTFADAARVSGGGGVIHDMTIIDDAAQDAELELWLFNQDFTAISDNAAWAPSEADLENLVGVISTADGSYYATNGGSGPSVAKVANVGQRFDCNATALYGQLVTRGTPTYDATDDLSVKIGLLQD